MESRFPAAVESRPTGSRKAGFLLEVQFHDVGRFSSVSPSGLVISPFEPISIRGMRPIFGPSDIAVLNRVPMDIIKVVVKISFVSDHVIPEAWLPEVKGCCDTVCFFEVEGVIALDAV